MIDALDEANAPQDTDEATESLSSSMVSEAIHTKLGSPKLETTLKEFMEVATGPGNPLPQTFQAKLETFLNYFCRQLDQPSYTQYLKVRKEDMVMGFILIVYVSLI